MLPHHIYMSYDVKEEMSVEPISFHFLSFPVRHSYIAINLSRESTGKLLGSNSSRKCSPATVSTALFQIAIRICFLHLFRNNCDYIKVISLIWPLTSILTPALWTNEGFFTQNLTQIPGGHSHWRQYMYATMARVPVRVGVSRCHPSRGIHFPGYHPGAQISRSNHLR